MAYLCEACDPPKKFATTEAAADHFEAMGLAIDALPADKRVRNIHGVIKVVD